jgi:hypothetical protein
LDLLKCEADLVGSLADVLPDPDAPRKLTKALHIVRASGAKSAFEAMSWGGSCKVICCPSLKMTMMASSGLMRIWM